MDYKKSSTTPKSLGDIYAERIYKKSSTTPFLKVTIAGSVTDSNLPPRDRFVAAARSIHTHLYLHELFITGFLFYVFFSVI